MKLVLALLIASSLCASANTIRGRVAGSDGRAIRGAHIVLYYNDSYFGAEYGTVDSLGSFALTPRSRGLLMLRIMAPDHIAQQHRVLLDSANQVDVRATLARAWDSTTHFDSIVTFVRSDTGWVPYKLTASPSGEYSYTILTGKVSTVRYRLDLYAHGSRTPLCSSIETSPIDSITFAGGTQVYCVAKAIKGKVIIRFNPKVQPRVPGTGGISITSSDDAAIERELVINDNLRKRIDSMAKSLKGAGSGQASTGVMKDIEHLDSLQDMYFKQADTASDRRGRSVILARGLSAAFNAITRNNSPEHLETIFTRASATDLAWSIYAQALVPVGFSQHRTPSINQWLDEFLYHQPARGAVPNLILALLRTAERDQDTVLQTKLHSLIETEFADHTMLRSALAHSDPLRSVQTGRPCPPFSAYDVRDNILYDNRSLKGSYYLIDFWATWCQPCLAQTPNLAKAYATFGPTRFRILGVSLDASAPTVVSFLKKGKPVPMPWVQLWQSGEFKSPIARAFDVTSIPRMILVGPDGNIIAEGAELEGQGLYKILEQKLR